MRLAGIAVLVAVIVSGCLPTTTATRRTTSRTLGKLEIGPSGDVELNIDRDVPQMVIVTAVRNHHCKRQVVDQVEIDTTTKARLIGTTNGQSWGWFLLAPLAAAYPVGIADAAIAGSVALLTPDTSRQERVAYVLATSCRAPARARIYMTLASGQQMDSLSDEHGVAAFVLPAGEDPRTVQVRSELRPPQPPPIEAVIDGVPVMITPNRH